jgi:8-oxo-dGTP pyrophosphatase MutT (NUDIX family)
MPYGRRAQSKSANRASPAAEAGCPAASATTARRAVSSSMVWKPDVTVAAVIERSGRFLLVEERIRGRLVLNQPAGHLEDGEALLDAVIRETLEETAWQFTPEALLGVYQWRSARGHTTLRFAFTGTVQAYDADRPLDPPIVTTHWLAHEEIAQRSARLRTPLVLRCIEDYLAGRRLPLNVLAAESDDPKLSW